MRRDQLPPTSRHTFVLERHKIVYVSTPKVACTSIKWVLAEMAGEDTSVFHRPAAPGSEGPPRGTKALGSQGSSIHQRRLWRRVPTLDALSDQQLAQIDGADGWHVFAVVRHPTSRLWSSWQQKLLRRVPRTLSQVPAHVVPPLPRTTADVVDGFQQFVAGLAAGECGELLRENGHFRLQTELLAAERMPYTRVYTLDEMDLVMSELNARARAAGGDPVQAGPSGNESTLKPQRRMFTPDVLEGIRGAYRTDFDRWFPDADPMPAGVIDDEDYPAAVLDELRRGAEGSVPVERR